MKTTWREAGKATLHCLTGCALGEIVGMVIGTALGWAPWNIVALSVSLAFLFGYALTMHSVLKTGVGFISALGVALAADTVSITVMEVVDNGIMLAVPGVMEAGIGNPLFWVTLFAALIVAFFATLPVNKYLIGKGLGHAKMHHLHH